MRKLVVILPDGATVEVFLGKKKESLDQLQKLVGGYIEHVRVRFEGRIRDAYINEEGKLSGLPYNHQATVMYNETGQLVTDALVGNLVIVIPNAKI